MAKTAQRARELALLEKVIAHESLNEEEQAAFCDMRNWLREMPMATLSKKQSKWLKEVADKLEVDDDEDPAERNRYVPRGKEVEMPWTQNLPMKPPGRR